MDTSVIESHAEHDWIDRSDREATDLLRENLDLRAEVEKPKNLFKQSSHKSAAKAGNAIPSGSAVATQNRFEAPCRTEWTSMLLLLRQHRKIS